MPDTDQIDWIDNWDGTWTDPNSGVIVDDYYNVIGYDRSSPINWIDNYDGTFTDPQTGAIVDWDYNFIGYAGLVPRDGVNYGTDDLGNPIDLNPSQDGGGFFSSVGNFLSNLFGGGTLTVTAGSGGGGSTGGGVNTSGGQVVQSSAPRGALDANTKTILIAGAAAVGVYALTRRRND